MGQLQGVGAGQGALWQVVMINLLIRGSVQTDRPVGFKLGSNQLTRIPACFAEVLCYQTAASLLFCLGGGGSCGLTGVELQ